MRNFIDKFLQLGIKLCLLTGVAFTFAACYAPAPTRDERWYNTPDQQTGRQQQEQLEQTLRSAIDEPAKTDAL
ncbi:MAG: hypothetical protein IJ204_03610 [Paludibacteraceae bacterium]|nr:hypothetical protein [Paludibacteraceae bacterium]